ncbi:hypothetical protein AAKU52_002093 [Pedobacter sp. CG_S7]|uniref:hypothetical protein n=1 Tax=Pedobacter sp. CG_S7 TaxID=3143930 RepID=UPI0033920A2E
MKTLPYLKQLTYAAILLTFPLIFSASRDTSTPAVFVNPIEKPVTKVARPPAETIKTIKVTLDSLKKSSNTALKQI